MRRSDFSSKRKALRSCGCFEVTRRRTVKTTLRRRGKAERMCCGFDTPTRTSKVYCIPTDREDDEDLLYSGPGEGAIEDFSLWLESQTPKDQDFQSMSDQYCEAILFAHQGGDEDASTHSLYEDEAHPHKSQRDLQLEMEVEDISKSKGGGGGVVSEANQFLIDFFSSEDMM